MYFFTLPQLSLDGTIYSRLCVFLKYLEIVLLFFPHRLISIHREIIKIKIVKYSRNIRGDPYILPSWGGSDSSGDTSLGIRQVFFNCFKVKIGFLKSRL